MLQPGDIVGRHRVELVLGEGGAATVYRVRHTVLGTLHALKVLHVVHPDLRARLLEEGRIQARLRHANIVGVHDVLTVADCPALLMDFVPGGTLAARLEGPGMPLGPALDRFEEVVRGVAHAHADGVLHRDLHPGNVLLDDSSGGEVARVADFGIARVLDEDAHRRTRTGVAMGTPAYMAPEQAAGARDADARADLFSLGVMLYRLVTGRLPFADDDAVAALVAAREGRYPDPRALTPGLPEPVVRAIAGCLAPDPAARLPDCAALLAVLSERSREGSQGLRGATPPLAADPDGCSGAPAVEPAVAAVAAWPAVGAPEIPDARHVARATALVVDPTGQGHRVELQLVLERGSGRAWAPDGVERDAQVAAQLAMAAALGAEAPEWDVRWAVSPVGTRLHGTSLGLAVAVAVHGARWGRLVPEDWAFTGGVELDGSVTSVSGVPAKLRAAAGAGAVVAAIPLEGTAPALPSLEVVRVARLEDLLERLHPVSRPSAVRRWARLGLLVVPVLMALTSLLAPLEAWISHGVLSLTRGPLPMDDVAVLAVDVPDPRALRAEHPGTLVALADAGVRAVVFDLALSTATEHDEAIRDAITALDARAIPVVLPARFRLDGVSRPTPVLDTSPVHVGIVEARRDTLLDVVRALPLRRAAPDGMLWNASVLAAAALQRPADPMAPELENGSLVVGTLRSPAWAGLLHLPPLDHPLVVSYGDMERYGELHDRTVFIGAFGGSDDIHLTPGGRRYGVELLAGGLQTVLRQAALSRTTPEADAGLAFLTGVGTAWLAAALPRRRRRLALVVPGAAVAVSLALSVSGLLVAFLPMLVAAAVGLHAECHARRLMVGRPETLRPASP